MRFRVLGGFGVEGITEHDLGSRKARTLLKVLVLARGSPVSVDALADVLWADHLPARPADQVGVLVSRLRGVLGADRLLRSDAGYSLVADWLDIDEAAALAARAGKALAEGRVGAARAAAAAALDLVRGPLLPEEEGEWVLAERAAADAVLARARTVAIDAAVAAGDPGEAAALAEAALAHDPYDEVALRALMQAHLSMGRPASALAAYARVRERLAEDLGVSPTAATEALHAAALSAPDDDTSPRSALTLGRLALIGRETELPVLDAALVEARSGGTPLVVVSGEAGIGKTTLVEHWTARAESGGSVVLRGRCDELGRDLPLQPLADALADHLRSVGTERSEAIVGPDASVLAPLLGPVAGSGATTVADPGAAQAALFAALAGAVTRCAEDGVIVVVEDLHLASSSTVAWLRFARHRCRGALLLATTRAAELGPLADGVVLRLGPLSIDAVAQLVGDDRANELHARTGGHPLLLAALAPLPPVQGPPPASVREAVAVRVDALGDDVAATLRVAAVLGVECDVDLVAQVRGIGTTDVLEHLETAARIDLVVERGTGFAFVHELVRDALVAATGGARRALVHHQAAGVLAGRPRPDALAVAVHARHGGDAVLASSSYVTAAEAAVARFDVDAAEEYLTAAIELDPSANAYATRARVRMSRLALDEAAEDATRAVALNGGAQALEVAGWVAYYRRRYGDAGAYAERAVDQSAGPALRASALALAGRVRHGAGDLQGALDALTRPSPHAPPDVRGVADVWLAQVRNHQGRPLDALDALAAPMLAPDALVHPWASLHLRFNRVMALGQLGRVADALAVADELQDVVGRSGQVGTRFTAPAANVRAWVLRWSGRGQEADEANAGAFEASGGEAGPVAEAMAEGHYVALLDLADGCLQRGDPAAAQALANRLAGLATWTGTMAWHQRHRLGLLRARLALALGDRTAAAGLAEAVAVDAASRGAGRYEMLARAVLGLADPSVPVERLGPVVEGLGRCAVLDGWPLVAALGATRGVGRWQQEADRSIARVVNESREHGDLCRKLATDVLDGLTSSPLVGR